MSLGAIQQGGMLGGGVLMYGIAPGVASVTLEFTTTGVWRAADGHVVKTIDERPFHRRPGASGPKWRCTVGACCVAGGLLQARSLRWYAGSCSAWPAAADRRARPQPPRPPQVRRTH